MIQSVEVELPRNPGAGGRARRLLEDLAAGTLDAGELGRAKLLVSELVNNAVLHGHGSITLTADLDEDRLRVEVVDEGSGFECEVRGQEIEQAGGRGLRLVEAESSRWGLHEGTTHVWFEIERRGPRLGADKKPPTVEDE
ncbi:MAG: serine/threonine-protein kinase RsbW [Solirubrobacteraceae bacterium]|nr:serine/threonine-protein kinase RsbW [Solirubrobacteraceae bacterium]